MRSRAFRLVFLTGIALWLGAVWAVDQGLTSAREVAVGQDYRGLGSAVIREYPIEAFSGGGTNWFVQQHSNGVVFVSNKGLHSFDGANWREHYDAGKSVRQFLIHDDGRIYFGSSAEIGYLEPDGSGVLIYTSLLPQLPEAQRAFSDVNHVILYNERIFFVSPEQIMAYDGEGGFELWTPDNNRFSRAWLAGDRLFFSDGPHLRYFEDLEPRYVPLLGERGIRSFGFVTQLGEGYLVATFSQGIYLWKDGDLSVWMEPTRQEAALGLYSALEINDDLIAIGTIRGGVLFLNHAAETVYHLNTDNGLPVDITLNLFLDAQNGLWLAQEGRLIRAQLPFDLSVFPTSQFGFAKVRGFARVSDKVFLSAVNGIMSIDEQGQVDLYEDLISSAADLLYARDQLILAGTAKCQTFVPETGAIKTILATGACRDLLLSKARPGTLFMVTEHSVAFSRWDGERWQDAVHLFEDNLISSELVEDENGHIWVATRDGKLIKIWFDGEWRTQRLASEGGEHLPLVVDGVLLVSTDDGLFYWDGRRQKRGSRVGWFHDYFGEEAGAPNLLYRDAHGRLWIASEQEAGYFDYSNGAGGEWIRYPVAASGMRSLRRVYDDGDVVWLGFDTGVVRYEPDSFRNRYSATAMVSEVRQKGGTEPLSLSVFSNGKADLASSNEEGTLRVLFGLTSFLQDQGNVFRYRLGESPWSDWSRETYVDMGALSGGNYQLEMEALDIERNRHRAKALSFEVIPPWYLSVAAYAFYLLALLIIIWLTAKVIASQRTKKLLLERQNLAEIVVQRTATIQQQADELQKSNEAKTRFFANVSHEFRTPLTLVIGPLRDLLRNEKITDLKSQQKIEVALRNSEQMLSLVGQVLDINRLEAGEMRLAVSRISLKSKLEEILGRYKFLAAKRSVSLVTKGFVEGLDLWIDEDHFDKIINNLLSNALKFSPEGSRIVTGMEADNTRKRIVIWIEDQGPGIAAGDIEHIFDRFYQGQNSSNSLQPGTGIGLSMVKELLELHMGNIELESPDSGGCVFRINLNMGRAHYSEEQFSQGEERGKLLVDSAFVTAASDTSIGNRLPMHASQSGPSVLVVDDNEDLRHHISSILESAYVVIEAGNGDEALAFIEEQQPDFIISDVMMPVMDGIELTQKLKADPATAHIPLLLLTAKATKRDTVAGLEYGADDYLTKPFDSSELIARIAAHLKHKKDVSRAIYASFRRQSQPPGTAEITDSYKNNFSRNFIEFIMAKLDNADLDVEKMAAALNMDRSTLHRRVKKAFGCSPAKFLKDTRLKQALCMLRQRRGTISEIAYAVGFQSLNTFSRSFREAFDVTPSMHESIAAERGDLTSR